MSEDKVLKKQRGDTNRSGNNCSDSSKAQSAPLNRRRFLELTTLGIGGLGLLHHSNSALAATGFVTATEDNINSIGNTMEQKYGRNRMRMQV